MVTIQPFAPSDDAYAALAAIHNAIWTDSPMTAAEIQHYDRVREKKYLFQRLVATVDAQIVGVGTYGEPAWSYRPGKYHFDIEIHPGYEGRGIGSSFYNRIMQALQQREPQPVYFTTGTREDKAQGIRFLEERGFQRVMRWPASKLDVTAFDGAPFAAIAERVQQSGIEIRTLHDLRQSDPNWQRKIYELDWECTQDEPLPDAPTKPPFDEYVRRNFEAPTFLPEGCFVALDGDQVVGLSELCTCPGEPARLETGFTCVARTHRRRGIATALKLHAIEFARQQGVRVIKTGNEESNPMYQINLKLGFAPQPAWLAFEKKSEDVPAKDHHHVHNTTVQTV